MVTLIMGVCKNRVALKFFNVLNIGCRLFLSFRIF